MVGNQKKGSLMTPETIAALELVKVLGFPALIFIMWFLYHRSESQKWEELIKNNNSNHQAQFQFMQNMLSQGNVESERIYQLLRDSIEVASHHSSILARMEGKIDTNQYCPLVKEKR
jgi:hypothetical protein